jgi:hypothetical protein
MTHELAARGELMMLLRTLLAALATFGISIGTQAQACSILRDPGTQKAELEEIASKGVVVRAKVIRGFDADKRQSEVLQVESIYVGSDVPRYLYIYRPEISFRQYIEYHRPKKSRMIGKDQGTPVWVDVPPTCPDFTNPLKQGDSYERIALVPVTSTDDDAARGEWTVTFSSAWMVREGALEAVLKIAKEQGRFHERPPKRPEFGDCMNCSDYPRALEF